MALYTGRLDLADAIMAPLVTDRPDGLYPDGRGRRARRMPRAWSTRRRESIREAVRRRMGIYQSRSRGLWVKGETSGATQELLRIDLDCDRDSPRFVVRQHGPGLLPPRHPHLLGRGRRARAIWRARWRRAASRRRRAATRPSCSPIPALLAAKLREEADELAEAQRPRARRSGRRPTCSTSRSLAWPREGIDLAEVEAHLDRRALKVTRRG